MRDSKVASMAIPEGMKRKEVENTAGEIKGHQSTR
jgi:hypothetical protein